MLCVYKEDVLMCTSSNFPATLKASEAKSLGLIEGLPNLRQSSRMATARWRLSGEVRKR